MLQTETALPHDRHHSHPTRHSAPSERSAVKPATEAKPKLYNPHHLERMLLYQTIVEYFETWLELASSGQFDGQGDHHTPKP